MINEIISMNGYGLYVWASFSFTLFSFASLYFVTKIQFAKEQSKFVYKFGSLIEKKIKVARSQNINKEILSNIPKI